MTEYAVTPGGTPKIEREATTNDSDKTFTVPTGKTWKLNSFVIDYTCSATVGNRNVVVSISPGGANNWSTPSTAIAPTASQHAIIEAYPGAVYTNTAAQVPSPSGIVCDIGVRFPMPPEYYLPAGTTIRALDVATIAAAADDMTVILRYIEYDA